MTVADLTPSRDNPGLHVSKPSKDATARGSYACRCGDSQTATGDDQVRGLVTAYESHKSACTGWRNR